MYLLESDPNVCISRRSQRVNIVPDGTLEKVRRLWNDGDSGPDCERRRQHRIPDVVRSSYSRSCRPTFVMSTPSMYMLPDAGSMMRNSERSSLKLMETFIDQAMSSFIRNHSEWRIQRGGWSSLKLFRISIDLAVSYFVCVDRELLVEETEIFSNTPLAAHGACCAQMLSRLCFQLECHGQ